MASFKNYFSSSFFSIFALAGLHLNAFEVNVVTAEGEESSFEFQSEEPLSNLLEMVRHSAFDGTNEGFIRIEFPINDTDPVIKAYVCQKAATRNYYAEVSSQERKDLSFILRTLANNSLVKIAKEKSNLKKAGDRIDNLHPFKFLETVFTDEELKVCIRNIEGKSWVWTEFRDGITSSLSKEAAVDNLKQEYVVNFAKTLNIDINAVQSTIQDKNWVKLISDLIQIVPRSGDSNRYNM